MADEKTDKQEFNLDSPQWYLNRELTWLKFNRRVLHDRQDPRTPLLERIKFLAIVGSNLDEFFMKRIGGLKHQIRQMRWRTRGSPPPSTRPQWPG